MCMLSRKRIHPNSIHTDVWQHIILIVTSQNVLKIYIDCRELEAEHSNSGEGFLVFLFFRNHRKT